MATMKHDTAARTPATTIFVLFGATGDLAKRMVIPAFYRLALEGLLPRQWLLIGNGRGNVAHEDFRKHVHNVLTEFGPKPEQPAWTRSPSVCCSPAAASPPTALAACWT
jgi:glucose-6-phosphate 1-dehydrogenase